MYELANTGHMLLTASLASAPETSVNPTSFSPITFALILFLATTIMGIVAVLGGTGGGVMFTPLMMGFTPLDSYIIRGTGLFVALSGSLIAARPFLRKGLASFKLLLFAAVPYSICAIVGALLAGYMDRTMGEGGSAMVKLILGCLVVFIALLMLLGGKKVEYPEAKELDGFSRKLNLGSAYLEQSIGKVVKYQIGRVPLGMVLFCFIGLISGMFGLGAGWAMVPVLNMALFAPLKVAVASSKVLIGIGDTGAVWPYMVDGAIFPLLLIPSVIGITLGTMIGARLMPRVKAGLIRWIVLVILLGSGGKLLVDGINHFL